VKSIRPIKVKLQETIKPNISNKTKNILYSTPGIAKNVQHVAVGRQRQRTVTSAERAELSIYVEDRLWSGLRRAHVWYVFHCWQQTRTPACVQSTIYRLPWRSISLSTTTGVIMGAERMHVRQIIFLRNNSVYKNMVLWLRSPNIWPRMVFADNTSIT